QAQWDEYMNRTFHQLMWWAQGAALQRDKVDPTTLAKAFTKDPSQRNAP
ncbi:MAG: NADPH-dependent oxidoreductase, partial [Psychromonas sp.]|nr:NADPH-dependent oxidoreductase [Psychromonas sp.]